MSKLSLLLWVFSVWMFSAAADPIGNLEPPDGWRYPTENELADEVKWREESQTKFARAIADFNGDGVPDEAYLFKSTKFSGQGLLVWLSDHKNSFKWLTLDVINWGVKYPNVDLSMGVEALAAGAYRLLCIEAGDTCIGETEPRSSINLKTAAISYFRFGSASSLFYWDGKTHRFVRVWLSD